MPSGESLSLGTPQRRVRAFPIRLQAGRNGGYGLGAVFEVVKLDGPERAQFFYVPGGVLAAGAAFLVEAQKGAHFSIGSLLRAFTLHAIPGLIPVLPRSQHVRSAQWARRGNGAYSNDMSPSGKPINRTKFECLPGAMAAVRHAPGHTGSWPRGCAGPKRPVFATAASAGRSGTWRKFPR